MFKRKDHVMYPGHGVAVVEDIVEKTVAGSTISFLKLSFLFKDMMILVPTYNVDAIGIRFPSAKKDVDSALQELCNQPEKKLESIDFTPSGWNRRFKDYQLKMQSGKLMDLIRVYRDLMYIAQQKDLSFGERTVLQNVEELITQEVQIVRGQERDIVMQWIRMPFKQLTFHDRTFLHHEVSTTP